MSVSMKTVDEQGLALLTMINLPDWDITQIDTFPRVVILTKMVDEYVWDEMRVQWSRKHQRWEVTAKRVMRSSIRRERGTDSQMLAYPVRSNLGAIMHVNLLLDKIMYQTQKAAAVVALGSMNFDPVEGEPDYDERYHKRGQSGGTTGRCAGDDRT